MARLSEHGIRLSSMSPSFLNSNSTSHTWPFSAVAELIDNASDPGVSAKQIWIDVVDEGDQRCLTFTDNGSGMTPNKLHKMLSFGFTEKGSGKSSQQAIGVYGNGFKSGSMRLGRDALIFTKNGGCQSVGMLSQTYLHNIKAQAVMVPIVPFNQQTKLLVVTEDSTASLAAILKHSIISSEEQIHAHFDSIHSKKGTKILIWNIRRAKDGKTEIDFETDPTDFRLPEIQTEEIKKGLSNSGSLRHHQNIPDMYYSLRAYLSILYLKPRTQVILRGKKIQARLVSKKLSYIEHDVYKPQFSKEKVKVTFGINSKNKDHYGIMMYHKNRLIKAYEKVGYQLKVSGQRAGIGVIGVIECNFLKPAHNKQDFEYTKEYRLTLGALGLKLNDYWKEVADKKAREREFQTAEKDDEESQQSGDEGPMWLQCEDCLKWRSIPANYYKVTPESWNCSQNPNPRYRSCSSPEEGDESEEQLTPSYQKTHKKLENRKRQRSFEVDQSEKPKQLILSHTSVTPEQPLSPFSEMLRLENHPEGNASECLETDSLDPLDQNAERDTNIDAVTQKDMDLQDKSAKNHAGIRDKNEAMQAQIPEDDQPQDKESDTKEDRHKNISQEKNKNIFSRKKNPELRSYNVKKKQYLFGQNELSSANVDEDSHHGKQTSSQVEMDDSHSDNSGVLQLNPTSPSHTWTQSLQTTQMVIVPPLNRGDHPLQPPEGGDREAKLQRLATMEKEVLRLRGVLGLEVERTTQGTMTADDKTEKEQAAIREVGCQTDPPECLRGYWSQVRKPSPGISWSRTKSGESGLTVRAG
ncbi:MORC family CW-type zinc finger protein 3-like isoform X2 [Oryzias latipes]|uniref:MORC family CW-type zinc finger protein 3-like isoform X2 n=1 Tax=Oryzias latipes TaxID=8090 RepID=UPI0005CBFEEC|nr:MORC family CW-type zinc finger protein 3-like isoform X2 [Oryzias latipes]